MIQFLRTAIALIVAVPLTSHAAEPEQTSLRECPVHQPLTSDCHVHEKDTYFHLRGKATHSLPPHAKADYRKLDREHSMQLKR